VAAANFAIVDGMKGRERMSASPIEVVGQWLKNLNTENAELNKIMPWAGTSFGPQAFLKNLSGMFSRWDTEAFNVTTMFAADENVAVFGNFRYKSKSLGKVVASPFAILVKVVDGKVTYLQFLEDTYATASSFRKDGSWTIQTEPDAEPFQV
jgi:ketosteroid isomerase-like protein